MSILSGDEIRASIESGEIRITPYDETAIGPASIDLRLSNSFRMYRHQNKIIEIKEETDYKSITERIDIADGETFLLPPGQACLGITVEEVHLSPNLCGLLEGRSRFARLGLFVHITAGFMNPGIGNRQVLEIYNASNNTIALVPGTRVCQFVFMRMSAPSKYQGKFKDQDL
eukprot:TRINITY_DN1226_c0_g1_i1.p1 TRINITY_DN1226_c0_g1~~TRINITY_DN1226_c0_g1_i1.p1  ORF type:complete len:172 (+),score=49.34 TRINITY_DN1226_c0_g1_i1:57-572(+)